MLRSKLSLIAATAVALSLAFAVPDAAADRALVTRPLSVAGYRMQVVATVDYFRSGESVNRLRVALAQRSGASIQRHSWEAEERSLRLSASADLRGGHLRARFSSGGYIDMRFEANAAASRRRMPLCGRHRRSEGSLTGTLRLPTGSRRFGTVVRRRFHAWLARDRSIGCRQPWEFPRVEDVPVFIPDVVLSVSGRRGAITVVNDGDTTVQLFERWRDRGRTYHAIVARSPQRRFSFAKDFSTARTSGIGPNFDGAMSFSATSEINPDPVFGGASGRVRGDFRVNLAVPGPFTVPPASAFLGTISP